MNKKHLFGMLLTFAVGIIISIVIRSCVKREYMDLTIIPKVAIVAKEGLKKVE